MKTPSIPWTPLVFLGPKGNGRRPGEGGRSYCREKHNRVTEAMEGRGGPFGGCFGAPYPRGGPPQECSTQSGQAGGPPHGGQVGWGTEGGAGQGAAGPANPVGAGGGYNQMSPPSLPSPFGIGGRWGSQAARSGAQLNPRSRWGPPMVPRPPQQQQPRFAGHKQPGFIGQEGAQRWQVPWCGQPMMQGWGPQGGQPFFRLGSGGSQIGQLNP